MKTRIKKIIIAAAALFFVSSGVSFAHDRDDKPPGKAYGHYKVKKHHPGWNNKHYKPKRHHRERYVNNEVHHHHYENHHRRLNKKHFKPGRHHRKRVVYKEIHHHHYKNHHRRPAPREAVIYKAAFKDPKIIFKIIMKEQRLF
jgi:hypothetical protein